MSFENEKPDSYFKDPQTGAQLYKDAHGVVLEVRDVGVHQAQRHDTTDESHFGPDSHKDFFTKKLAKMDPKRVKQTMRRSEAIKQEVAEMVMSRADVSFHPDVEQVSDDTFINRLRHDPTFVPLVRYIDKLKLKNGKMVRPILKGEVGMIGQRIYVLEAGASKLIQVGADLEKSDDAQEQQQLSGTEDAGRDPVGSGEEGSGEEPSEAGTEEGA